MSKSAHDKAILAAEELISDLPLTDEEKKVAVGMAYDRFKSVTMEIGEGGASRDTISAVFAAALKYSEVFWAEVDGER